MKTTTSLTLAALMSFAIGCDVPEIEAPRAAAPPAQETASEPAEQPAEEDFRYNRNDPGTADSTPRKATGFDGKRGKLSRQEGGYLGTVLGSGMYAQHQAVFLQVEQAINIHYGLHGDFPKSHEEFMKDVIEFNNIQLPELSEGDEYIYDPEDHTLKIYRPGDEEADDVVEDE